MLLRKISFFFSDYLLIFSLALLLACGISGYYYFISPAMHPQPHSFWVFLSIFFGALLTSWGLRKYSKRRPRFIYRNESFILVAGIWGLTIIFGALPFYLSGTLGVIDSLFESTSGITTTGATVMEAKSFDPQNTATESAILSKNTSSQSDEQYYYGTIDPVRNQCGKIIYTGVEAVSKGILFWRSFLQWLGGMGIIVLLIALTKLQGIDSRSLYRIETSGPIKEGLTPRIRETAINLWQIYTGLTFLLMLILSIYFPHFSFFDVITLTFSTISTGGLSTQNSNIAAYKSSSLEWILILFMFIGSVNFKIYFNLLKQGVKTLLDREFLCYCVCIFIGSVFVIINIYGLKVFSLEGEGAGIFSWADAIRTGAFQYISAQTSTGFATVDFDTWPDICHCIMIFGMFCGGMAGSTGGGIKISRLYLLFYLVYNHFKKMTHPDAVYSIRFDNKLVQPENVEKMFVFFIVFMLATAFGTLFYILDGIDMKTAFSVACSMVNNTGVAFGSAGPSGSCAFLSPCSKLLSIFLMLLGRLECFGLLILCIPSFWERK